MEVPLRCWLCMEDGWISYFVLNGIELNKFHFMSYDPLIFIQFFHCYCVLCSSRLNKKREAYYHPFLPRQKNEHSVGIVTMMILQCLFFAGDFDFKCTRSYNIMHFRSFLQNQCWWWWLCDGCFLFAYWDADRERDSRVVVGEKSERVRCTFVLFS